MVGLFDGDLTITIKPKFLRKDKTMPTDKQAQEYAFASADRAKQTADKHWQKIVDAHKEEIARLKETIKNLEEKNLR